MASKAAGSAATPPALTVPVILYDGNCQLCTVQAASATRLAAGKVAVMQLQLYLGDHPGLSAADASHEMKLIDADGKVYGGAESIVRFLGHSRPLLGRLARVYYLPGVRWLADRAYAWVAKNRYRLFGASRQT